MKDTAVVVSSCDKYRDIWEPFFTSFFRYWRDCPLPIFLVSDHLIYDDPRVTTVNVGEDHDWSSSFRKALQVIPHPYVIVLLEDFMLTAPVDTDRILKYVEYMKVKGASCFQLFRLLPMVGPVVPSDDDPNIGIISKGAPYRISMQPAVWDKRVLCELLNDGESIWEFETKGTARSNSLETLFLSLNAGVECPIPYMHSVIRGKWGRRAVALFKRENISVDWNSRAQTSTVENMSSEALFRWVIFKRSAVTKVAYLKSYICNWITKRHSQSDP